MPTLAQIEQQILVVEGFRVRLEPLVAKTKSYPSYDFTTMAPQRWKISDWKNIRLKAYVTLVRGIAISAGDGTPVKGDPQLGNLRDTYYKAQYGTLDPSLSLKKAGREIGTGTLIKTNARRSPADCPGTLSR